MQFREVIGHEEAKDRLRAMVAEGKVPHAILISGPSGVGKMRLARAFAQYVNCRHHTADGDSCGKCPICVQYSTLNAADMHFTYPMVSKVGKVSDEGAAQWREFITENPYMDPAKWQTYLNAENSQPIIYVDEAAEIMRHLSLTSLNSSKKVQIIWLPEKLHLSAANKMLKIIEEPPEDTIFILVSNSPMLILPTIYSRCQHIKLGPLKDEEISRWLQENCGFDTPGADALAPVCEGNVNKALAFADLNSERRQFAEIFAQMMRNAYARKGMELKKLSLTIADMKREKSKRFFEYCAAMVRENYVHNLHNPQLNKQLPEEAQFSDKFAPFISDRNVEGLVKAIDDAARDVERNSNAKIVALDFLFQIMLLIR